MIVLSGRTVPNKLQILHLGLGAFHRAHQAAYLQDLYDSGSSDWQIIAGNIRPGDEETIEALQRQQGRYTLETVTTAGERQYCNIETIATVIPFQPDLRPLALTAADPHTRILSFTATEAGYYLDANDHLDLSHSALRKDIEFQSNETLYGAMALLLERRRLSDTGPLTLLSCDNLKDNGLRFHQALCEFLVKRGQLNLLEWVCTNTTSPNSMVDRITPKPDKHLSLRLENVANAFEGGSVGSERFRQWVIEDNFIAGRPAWQDVGADLVDDVTPYETAKLQILNGAHSVTAWAGLLNGHKTVHESIRNPLIRQFVGRFITEEVMPSIGSSPVNLERYRDDVIDRFSNPHIVDTNERILTDSIAKIGTFLLPTIRQQFARNDSVRLTATALIMYLNVLRGCESNMIEVVYNDQLLSSELKQRLLQDPAVIEQFANEPLIFKDLAGDKRLMDTLAVLKENQKLPGI